MHQSMQNCIHTSWVLCINRYGDQECRSMSMLDAAGSLEGWLHGAHALTEKRRKMT